MTPERNENEETQILVELKQKRGEQDVALSPSEIAERSSEALNNAMKVIHNMARKVMDTLSSIPITERPSSAEVEFGLKLTSEANALIANAGIESQINVKLSWTHTKDQANS